MDVFYIITNHLKDPFMEYTARIRSYLEEHGKKCYVQPGPAEMLQSTFGAKMDEAPEEPELLASEEQEYHWRFTNADKIPEDVECVLVLGGDGTLLRAARDLIGTGLPLLGINLGTLGYLAEVEIQNANAALDKLMEGKCSIEKRMLLSGTVYRQGRCMISDIALNDITVSRRGRLRVVDFNVFVDNAFLCSYRADGIILSTPTGSTGYSLSAGGPIVAPDASLLLLTAVAPHTLSSRSVILPDHVEVSVEVAARNETIDKGAEVIFDGDTAMNVGAGDRIRIMRSEKYVNLIKINNRSFVEILRKKMN